MFAEKAMLGEKCRTLSVKAMSRKKRVLCVYRKSYVGKEMCVVSLQKERVGKETCAVCLQKKMSRAKSCVDSSSPWWTAFDTACKSL